MRMSVVFVGRFSRRHIVGCEQSSSPVSGKRPTAISSRIVAQGVAVVGVFIAGGDQQTAETDHLDKAVPHPLGRSWIRDAAGQPFGDLELALDLGQQQHTGIRGQPATIEGEVHRLTGNR